MRRNKNPSTSFCLATECLKLKGKINFLLLQRCQLYGGVAIVPTLSVKKDFMSKGLFLSLARLNTIATPINAAMNNSPVSLETPHSLVLNEEV